MNERVCKVGMGKDWLSVIPLSSRCITCCSSCISHVFLHGDSNENHEDFIQWKYFRGYWPSVLEIRRLPVDSPHKGQWRGTLMLTLNSARTNVWANNRDAGDLRHHRAHYDVAVMYHTHTGISNNDPRNGLTSWRISPLQCDRFSSTLQKHQMGIIASEITGWSTVRSTALHYWPLVEAIYPFTKGR